MRSAFYIAACFFVLSSAWAREEIRWFGDEIPLEDTFTLQRLQYIIMFDDVHGNTHTGMAFPTSETRIVTAAHLFPYGKVGDSVRIATHHFIGSTLQWQEGKIARIEPANDFAVVHLTTPQSPLPLILRQCQDAPSPGTAIAVYKPEIERNAVTSSTVFRGVVTPLRTMPLVSIEVEKRVPSGNYSLRAQSGSPRIVAAGEAIPGASGGAIWDTKRKCVVGIVSVTGPFHELEDRQATLAKANNPPFMSFVIGALIQPE